MTTKRSGAAEIIRLERLVQRQRATINRLRDELNELPSLEVAEIVVAAAKYDKLVFAPPSPWRRFKLWMGW